MLDQRSLAERSADLELEQVRLELNAWGQEMRDEGLSDRHIVGNFCCELEERLACLYRKLYEVED